MKKKVIITGGSGFIGSHLSTLLLKKGYDVVILDRVSPREPFDFVQANIDEFIPLDVRLKNPYAVIHLAGKSIFGRFAVSHKKEIYESRVSSADNLHELFTNREYRPKVFVSASAVGYFGDRGDELLDEASDPGASFLSEVVQDWEEEALHMKFLDIRSVVLRQGHIFGEGGFLSVVTPWYRRGLGGFLGNGLQWLPWIHLHDLAQLYVEAIENNSLEGVYHAVSHTPIQYRDFSHTLAHVLDKPHWFRIPGWLLALRLGYEFAREMTSSQRVVSRRLHEFQYKLQFNHLESALRKSVKK